MDIYQLQRQIQDLRQEVNTINQVASQLQRSEANNAAQLQRLHQNEAIATQQLHTIQQLCNRLNQDVNVISNVAQQVTSQMFTRPITSGQWGAYSQPTTGQFGAFNPSITTGWYSQGMMGMPSNIASTYTANLGTGITPFASNVRLETPQQMQTGQYGASGFVSAPFAQNIRLETPQQTQTSQYQHGATGFAGIPFASNVRLETPQQNNFANIPFASNISLETPQQMQSSQYGTTGFAGSHLSPYSASHISASAMPTTGLWSQPLASSQNLGMYSSF
ncbi:hypothetical protein [Pelotomaculum propionicicum]|uniref:Uncharacterized protein n=1 Tax=Pelotomaculum propionicicum TaxID=258475 RepID=A0A4Y7RJY8_9FIRM|nr:hypothetical protein [Pelotomaculum propionicicum]TEB09060.1 hypothetical protein Pmgp_03412 [Pelotomaculum propionicicum]